MITRIEELFRQQTESWPLLAAGIQGLRQAQTRQVRVDWVDVYARHIPHRIVSTTAAIDRESIEKRPCFLCAGNMPAEQRGIEFNRDFTLYCNPYPIVAGHLTIVHVSHRPQRIDGQVGAMLEFARSLTGCFIVYNGPECGASAPDHLHFQAGLRDLFPIETDLAAAAGPLVRNYRRNVILLRGHNHDRLVQRIERAIQMLSEVTGKSGEPLINIAAFWTEAGWTVFLFPRGKHRPDVFYTGELTVSPASIDLCGIFVVPREPDYSRISAQNIAAIYEEVSLPAAKLDQIESCL